MSAKFLPTMGFEPRTPAPSPKALPTRLSRPSFLLCCNQFYFATSFTSEREQKKSLKNEERKREKSLEQSKNVLEEKLKNGQAKTLHEKDQHVYNNCYELRSRAMNNFSAEKMMSLELITRHWQDLRKTQPDFALSCSVFDRAKKTNRAQTIDTNFFKKGAI